MVRRAIGLGALVALCAALAACTEVDFVAVSEPVAEPGPTRVGGTVRFEHRDSLRVGVQMDLVRGADEDGIPLPLDDPSLVLLDTAIAPVEMGDGVYRYRAELAFPPPPALPDPSLALPGVMDGSLPLPRLLRRGPWEIPLVHGEDLALAVDGVETLEGQEASPWRLAVGGGCAAPGTAVEIRGPSPPPDSLSVPWTLLERETGDVLVACLQVGVRVDAEGDAYRLGAFIESRLTWRVRVVEPG